MTTGEKEIAFMGCLLYNAEDAVPKAIAQKVKEEWFTDATCRYLWKAVETLWSDGDYKIVTTKIVQTSLKLIRKAKLNPKEFRVNVDFLDECVKFIAYDEMRDIENYISAVRDDFLLRKAKTTCEAKLKAAEIAPNPRSELCNLAAEITGLVEKENPIKLGDCNTIVDGIISKFDRAYEEFTVKHNYDYCDGIPYPWRSMNHIANGLQPGGLHIIAARPSVGKTSFVLQMIDYWCSIGLKVSFNCLDMSVSQLMRRPIATISQVGLTKAAQGRIVNAERESIARAASEIRQRCSDGRFVAFSEYDVNAFKSFCLTRKLAGKLDIAIVDYAQQLRISKGGRMNENERLTEISAILKSIAIELNIPVIALSQLSRTIENEDTTRDPRLSDLRGSGALEQDAMSVSFLTKDTGVQQIWKTNPPVIFCPNRDPYEAESIAPVWWILLKNQNGGLGRLPFIVKSDVFTWYLGAVRAEVPNGSVTGKYLAKFKKITPDWRKGNPHMRYFEDNGLIA